MLAVHLAMRYLRRRRMAWLAMAAVAITVAVSVIMLGVMEGWVTFTTRQVRAAESDLTLTGFYRPIPEQLGIDHLIDDHDGVVATAPYVETPAAMVPDRQRYRRMIPVQVEGVDWQRDRLIGRLSDDWLHARPSLQLDVPPLAPEERGTGFLTPDTRAFTALAGLEMLGGIVPNLAPVPLRAHTPFRPGFILGRELLYEQGGLLEPGDTIKLALPDGKGGLVGQVRGEVSDTVGTGVLEIDRYLVLTPLLQGQQLTDNDGKRLGSVGTTVDGYRIRGYENTDPVSLRGDLEADAQLLEFQKRFGIGYATWQELRGNAVRLVEVNLRTVRLVMIALQLLCVFTVAAVFSTLVAEKRHDIGVLLGLGARPSTILGTYLIAAVIACVAGGMIGWGVGWALLAALNPVSEMLGVPLFPQSVIYAPEAPIHFDIRTPLLFIGIQMGVGLVSAFIPAAIASRIDPVDTIREAG